MLGGLTPSISQNKKIENKTVSHFQKSATIPEQLFIIILSKDNVDFKLIILESFSRSVEMILTFSMFTVVI